ncbi:MAG: DUF3060 domain-containing protein, partial [Rhodocyclaceae bacterium]|nr:DUF3060 domain-containing protein [Rhodocyclaceae bacterium]
EGADIVIGGAGRDYLFGQGGDDILYATAELDPLAAHALGQSQSAQDAEKSWLDGGDGDDRLFGDAGADILLGGAGGDLILGGGGDDHLTGDDEGHPVAREFRDVTYLVEHRQSEGAGGARLYGYRYSVMNQVERRAGGADALYGGAGADWLFGQGGDDYLDGGADADVAFGDEGDDTVLGGAGDDVLAGDNLDNAGDPDSPGLSGSLHGQDYLEGGAGNDRMAGNGGGDVLHGDAGDDEINGDDPVTPAQYHGDDYLDGGAGADTLVGAGGNDEIHGGDGDDTIAGDGEGIAAEFQGNDRLDGGAGNDYLRGHGGDDTLIGGEGSDELHGEAGDDVIDGGEGNDLAFGEDGDDRLAGGAGNDALGGGEGADTLDGGAGDDILVGEAGNDVLQGGAGNDQLSGGEGNDMLAGGAGQDLLDGGLGDDTYVIDAADLLAAPGSVVTGIQDAGGANRLILEGMDLGTVTAAQGEGENAGDLVLTLGEGSRLTIAGGAAGTIQSYGTGEGALLDAVGFLDATAGGRFDLTVRRDRATVAGGRGDDHLHVSGTGNTIAGGKGNDLIEVGGSDNLVDYRAGDGVDTLRSLAATGTAIRFGAGIAPSDIRLRLDGGELVIGIGEGTESAIRLAGFDPARPFDRPAIAELRFADGSSITYGVLLGLGLEVAGTDGDDAMQGTGLNDRMLGMAGNDVLNGGAGDDALSGGEGDDVLNGGAGSDALAGGAGADIYGINASPGTKTLADADGGRIELGTGIALSGIGAARQGADLLLTMPDGAGGIVIQGYFDAPQSWTIRDTSGESATAEELLSGTWEGGRDWLRGLMNRFEQSSKLALADGLIGQGYAYAGPDELRRYVATQATASFVSGEQTQRNTYEWFDGRSSTDTRTYSLDDWRTSQLAMVDDRGARIGTQTESVSGTAYFDGMWSAAGGVHNEQKWVGMSWRVTSLSDEQTRQWSATDWIISGGTAVGLVTSDNLSRYQTGAASGSVVSVLSGPPAFVPGAGQLFPDVGRASVSTGDTTYSFRIVEAGAGDDEITGGGIVKASGGDDVVATRGFIDGGDGNDRLYNGAVMFGGHGDDLLWGWDNSVSETEEGHRYGFAGADQGSDLVVDEGWIGFSEGSAEYYYSALDPYFLAQGAEHWSARYFHAGEWVVDDGQEWRSFFQSEEDAQAAAATWGGTVVFVEPLPGALQVHADDAASLAPLVAAGLIADDTVEFGPGIAPEDLAFAWGKATPEGLAVAHDTLDIIYGAGSVARIVMPNSDDYLGWGIERFRFADGRRLMLAEILALAPPRQDYNLVAGTEEADTLVGTALKDLIVGAGGDDALDGLGGDDELDGGNGNDTLIGGAGSDTFRFGRGSGLDTVVQTDAEPGDADMVRFEDDVRPEQVAARRENDALLLAIAGTGDTLTLEDWFAQPDTRVGRVAFSDGTVWTSQALEQAPVIIDGTSGVDFLEGTGGNDVLDGKAGDDHLQGGAGDDVYLFARGDGSDRIEQGDAAAGDADTIRFGAGIAPGEIAARLDWDGLHLAIGDAGDALLLADWFNPTDQRIDRVEFADGTVLDNAALEALAARTAGSDADDALWGTSGGDVMTGLGGADQIHGGAGNDALDGGAGYDNLDGGAGSDVYMFSRGNGEELIYDTGPDTDIDALRFAADIVPSDIVVTRDEWNLYLTVRGTEDVAVLDGWFSGPEGRIERVEFADGTVWEANSLEGRLYDSRVAGTAGNDRLNGTAGRDLIEGFEGDDVLNGRAGADAMLGGTGNDTYHIDDAGDAVSELADEGADRVVSTVSHVLGENVENLTLSGTAPINGTGNALSNAMVGNAASNTLDGQGGDDRLTGGAGDDILVGGEGNDVLNGSAGADTMAGGVGNDTYHVDDLGDTVTEFADEGTDRVVSAISYTLGENLENLTLFGTEAIGGTGNALNNVLAGNAASNTLDGLGGDDRITGGAADDVLIGGEGNDVLNGSAGADAMSGGAGNDIYYVDDTGDVVTEAAGEGTDRVVATVTYLLADDVENLTLSGAEAINGFGNALGNVLAGNAATNLLSAGAGIDRLNGATGLDFLDGGEGDDVLADLSGAGYFNGGAGNDSLRGDAAADFFMGGIGNDSLNTGTGADVIAFNLGDGQDTVAASTDADNVLSLGGGIDYADIRMRKSGNHLVLDIGASDRITLANWYAAAENRSVLRLQAIAEAMAGFDAGGADALRDNLVETFDFAGLSDAFDAARAANPGLTSWAITEALTQFHLSGSDTAALGGDLAYQYGRSGTLAGIGLTAAQEVLGDAQFGAQAQSLRPLAGLQDGAARLG